MMKKFLAFTLALAMAIPAMANEGMWLPLLLGRNYEDMKAHGLQLTPEDIYSVNQSSLKDAIVSLGGFCTAEVISDQGLLLTNHHCGFDAIRTHSTVDEDYLTDGFWARSLEEEKPNEDLFVRFLVRMEDVTGDVVAELHDEMTEKERAAKIREVGSRLADSATMGTDYDADVKSFFHGNEFYLFVYNTYKDVRLVGAPPSSVGKFGGDTDNWMWPRHTGDFSLFRIYSDKEGNPAEYSEENIPLKPKHHLPISLDGVEDGDFTMVFGFPGSTDRYLTSHGVKQAVEKYNPTVVNIRDKKLDIMKKYMDADNETRIQYASKYARTSNYWKYYIGQTEQLKNNDVYSDKLAIENRFKEWVNADPARKAKYGDALTFLEEAYKESDDYVVGGRYVLEAGLIGSELPLFAYRFNKLMEAAFEANEAMDEKLDEAETDEEKEEMIAQAKERRAAIMAAVNESVEEHFKNYNKELDKELFAELFKMYAENVPAEQQPEFFRKVEKRYRGNWDKYADKVYKKSMLTSKEEVEDFLEKPKSRKLEKDWATNVGNQLYGLYQSSAQANEETNAKKQKGYRLLTAGLREMDSDKNYYPDANSTMRVTYGTVGSYQPRDGVFYDHYTTADGILQKKDNDDPEFVVPEKLESLIKNKNFGPYTNENGELPVCFIHNTDITGGNSGSPVINGKGELIGCAFDGNWEAMSGDIFFEDELQRTISVDARYILFIIDKYAGATNLINEMTLVQTNPEEEQLKSEEDTSAQKTEAKL